MFRYLCMTFGLSVALCASQDAITLAKAYEYALSYEAKVRSTAYQLDAKKEDVTVARSQLYPQLSASLSYSDRKYTDNFYKRETKEQYKAGGINASQVLYHPEILSQIESAELKVDSAEVYLEKQKQELAYKVADAYISILKYQNSVAVAQSYLKTNEIKHQQIAEKFEMQMANKMDFLESKVAYEQAKITLHKQENLLLVAKLKLKNLIGVDVQAVPNVSFDALELEALLHINTIQNLENNPDIKMAQIGTAIYEKEVESAKYGHYPKLDLSFSHTEYQTDDISVDYERDSRVMLEFKIPLFQGGRVNALVEKNRVLLNAAKEDLSDQQREVKLKYEELVVNYQAALEEIKLQKAAEISASLYLSAVQKGYEHGLKNLIDLEDAKTKLYETKFKLIDAVYTMINAYIGLRNITGALTSEDLEHLSRIVFKTE